MRKAKRKLYFIVVLVILASMLAGCTSTLINAAKNDAAKEEYVENNTESITIYSTDVDEDYVGHMGTAGVEETDIPSIGDIPEYSGQQTIIINNNYPYFSSEDLSLPEDYLNLSELDELGRCGSAYMCISPSTLATEDRGEIGMIKPSGWNQEKYPDIIKEDPSYLYNRCHLIAFSLSGINADERNLITGTRALNAGDDGMLPHEMEILDYVRRTGNHVLYRVTPVFKDNELVARGVLMEAQSKEDDTICFNIFVYNIQPGIIIDYNTGASEAVM